VINELALMAGGDGDQPKKAEGALVELLGSESEEDRWIAIRALKDLVRNGHASDTTSEAIATFEQDPKNNSILPSEEELVELGNRKS